jgi:hypothetical protein
MSNYPNFSKNQFLRAADFNTAALVTLSDSHDTNAQFHLPGLINPALATYTFTGMTVTAVLPAPFCIEFGSGALVFAHGTATNSDTQTYGTSFTSLVPVTTPIVAYLLASVVTIQQNPITIVGPPQGHPSFNPNFVQYTAYTSNVESLVLTASTTPANNVTTFEMGRTTLLAGQTAITTFDVSHVVRASSLLAPTGVVAGTYFPPTVTVGVDGRVTQIAQTLIGSSNLTTTGVAAGTYFPPSLKIGTDGRVISAVSTLIGTGNLTTTGVAAGSYTSPTLSIGADGRIITAVSAAYVHQGGGVGQLTNQVYIGWSTTGLKCTIDATDEGHFAFLEGAAFTGAVSVRTTLSVSGTSTLGNVVASGNVSVAGTIGSSTGISTLGSIAASANITTASQFSTNLGMISSGNISCGITVNPNPVADSADGILITPSGAINSFSPGSSWSTGTGTLHVFYTNGFIFVGSITTNGTLTFYNTASDRRLKENLTPLRGALDRMKLATPMRGNMISDQAKTQIDMFIADNLALAVPEAVTGKKDEMVTHTNVILAANGGVVATDVTQAAWEAGKLVVTDGPAPIYAHNSTWQASITMPVYQQADLSKTAPLHWAATLELEARVEAQDAVIATLQKQMAALMKTA